MQPRSYLKPLKLSFAISLLLSQTQRIQYAGLPSDDCRAINLTNQTSILFSSEPDISLLDKQGSTVGVIEVKGGADPAGALERYGAAKKSFEESRRNNAQVKTILVASCITSEVQTRIQQDPTISLYFNLTEILSNPTISNQFMQNIFSLLEA
jgi:XcyI restriction endonuclease